MTHELPNAPTLEVKIGRSELLRHNRWNAGYFEERFRQNEKKLMKLQSVPLGNFIPEELPDGSKGITYGQVGARKLSARGSVRYLQVINIRDTGIDFAVKPDRVAEGSHNDPERSRVIQNDILITNTAFRGTETLIGRCVVVSRNYGKLNISQDMDRVRVQNVNPCYVGTFLKTKFGQLQIQRIVHGVDSQKDQLWTSAESSDSSAPGQCAERSAEAVFGDVEVSRQRNGRQGGDTVVGGH